MNFVHDNNIALFFLKNKNKMQSLFQNLKKKKNHQGVMGFQGDSGHGPLSLFFFLQGNMQMY